MNYFHHNAHTLGIDKPVPLVIPALDDPLTVQIRAALIARETGIEVQELVMPL